jgi:hypothetical protein
MLISDKLLLLLLLLLELLSSLSTSELLSQLIAGPNTRLINSLKRIDMEVIAPSNKIKKINIL